MKTPLPKHPKQSEIVMYTKDNCPYCVAAFNLLTQKGVGFELINITEQPEKRDEMLKRAAPRVTVPQIFINSTGVGGYQDIKALDENNTLENLLFPKGRD